MCPCVPTPLALSSSPSGLGSQGNFAMRSALTRSPPFLPYSYQRHSPVADQSCILLSLLAYCLSSLSSLSTPTKFLSTGSIPGPAVGTQEPKTNWVWTPSTASHSLAKTRPSRGGSRPGFLGETVWYLCREGMAEAQLHLGTGGCASVLVALVPLFCSGMRHA